MASPDPDPPEWIGVRDLTLRFGHQYALNAMNFALGPGQFHVLAGNHNDGKSTLCRALAGLVSAGSGQIWVDGAVRRRYGIRDAAGLGIEYLGEAADVFPHLSALENITVGSYGAKSRLFAHSGGRDSALLAWLSGFGLPSLDKPAAEYSFEDQLLIKVLACLHKNPRLLILDETLERFNLERRAVLLAELRRRMAAGMSVIWATHKLDDALETADYITIVRNGRRYLTVAAGKIDRRSLIRMTYSSTKDYPGDSRDDFESYYNLIHYSEVLLENLPSGVLIMDASERVQFMNTAAQRLFGLESAYRSGMPLAEALTTDNAFLLDAVRSSLASRADQAIDGAVFAAPAGRILVDAQALAVQNDQGRLAVMLIVGDVSEREAMRRQLTIAHNLSSIGMLAAGVAHEVNNPLESIGNYISYLLRRVEGEEARRVLESVQKEAANIRDIVTNLVMFSGKGEKAARDVELDEMFRDIVHMLGYNSRYADIEIEREPSSESLTLRIDPNELRQIILNLIRNGMEAMPDGGAIVVRTSRGADGMGRIAIRDYGPGLPPELGHSNDIFLPFVSGKNGEANQGLGLSIVYGLVRKWGGDIAVEPAHPGTRFIVDLPLATKGA